MITIQERRKYARKVHFETAYEAAIYMLGRHLAQYKITKNGKELTFNSSCINDITRTIDQA